MDSLPNKYSQHPRSLSNSLASAFSSQKWDSCSRWFLVFVHLLYRRVLWYALLFFFFLWYALLSTRPCLMMRNTFQSSVCGQWLFLLFSFFNLEKKMLGKPDLLILPKILVTLSTWNIYSERKKEVLNPCSLWSSSFYNLSCYIAEKSL